MRDACGILHRYLEKYIVILNEVKDLFSCPHRQPEGIRGTVGGTWHQTGVHRFFRIRTWGTSRLEAVKKLSSEPTTPLRN
jgi:hypothetical protein